MNLSLVYIAVGIIGAGLSGIAIGYLFLGLISKGDMSDDKDEIMKRKVTIVDSIDIAKKIIDFDKQMAQRCFKIWRIKFDEYEEVGEDIRELDLFKEERFGDKNCKKYGVKYAIQIPLNISIKYYEEIQIKFNNFWEKWQYKRQHIPVNNKTGLDIAEIEAYIRYQYSGFLKHYLGKKLKEAENG